MSGLEAGDNDRPFLFNLVGNMQQRPWRQRLRDVVRNCSLPAALPAPAAKSLAAATAMQLSPHVVVLKGQLQHHAIVYAPSNASSDPHRVLS
jgi:hypothetical protein